MRGRLRTVPVTGVSPIEVEGDAARSRGRSAPRLLLRDNERSLTLQGASAFALLAVDHEFRIRPDASSSHLFFAGFPGLSIHFRGA